ncbi:hypothetical protein [Riemerella anatipestifer]|uniref:hypothetical protein n=1 Tax=Riemerella anatipestifer TaxID=34085 RepID=UPI0021F91810|nr:hypothetical protein [Riemerella anatipestifer]MCW0517936.1 hypothetical protein [Riemerella anatipestifer]WIT94504.1 hypothetical protein CRP19_000073 [Riemerella phage vB_RanS_CRP19]
MEYYLRERFSNSKKSKIIEVLIENEYGSETYSTSVAGNFKYCVSSKNAKYRKVKKEQVPEDILEDIEWFSRLNEEDYLEDLEIEKAREEREREEERRKKERKENSKATEKLSSISFDELFSIIAEQYKQKSALVELNENRVITEPEKLSPSLVLKPKINWYIDLYYQREGKTNGLKDYVFELDFINQISGFKFKVMRDPEIDRERIKFVYDICVCGEHIPNKQIVMAFSKKKDYPTFSSLRKKGFNISKTDFEKIDVHSVDSIKKLFSTYVEK